MKVPAERHPSPATGTRRPSQVSRLRKCGFVLIYLACLVPFGELAARVGHYVADGFNPYYLRFGFILDTEFHSYEAKGYSKFQPDTVKRQKGRSRGVRSR